MSRTGLFTMTMLAVTMTSGCAGQPPVPQWHDPVSPAPMPAPFTVSPVASAPFDGPPETVAGTGTAPDSDAAAPDGPAGSSGQGSADGPVAGEAGFLEAVRGQLPEVALDRRNEEITELGEQACVSLAAGQARRAVATEMTGYGVAVADARRLVSLARSTLCRKPAG
jgi:hypothetical protein